MSTKKKWARRAPSIGATVLAALILGACGGGGGADPAGGSPDGGGAPPVADDGGTVPSIASSSVGAMMAWAKSLVNSESSEPLSTKGFAAPVDDTTETSPG